MASAAAVGMEPQPALPAAGELTIDLALEQIDALLEDGDVDGATRLCTDLGRQCAPVAYAAGVLASARKDTTNAVVLYRAATLLAPDVPEFHLLLAAALGQLRDFEGSIEAADAALALEPSGRALTLLGNACMRLDRTKEAKEHLSRLVEREPENATAWTNLGSVWLQLGDLGKGADALEQALRIAPEFAEAWVHLGRALAIGGDTRAAIAHMRRARDLDPDSVIARSNLLFALSDAVDVAPEEVFEEHRGWGARMVELVGGAATDFPNVPDPGRRLRIGYVSPDLRRHPVAFFSAAMLTLYDHAAFDVACYFNHPIADQTSWQIRGRVDRWVEIAGKPDSAVADMIRSDGIDILVDLAGHTAGDRLGVFARRAAPVQVTYLGYTNTSGLPTMDYRITDRWSDPPGETERFHTERLVRPFESFVCYAPPVGSPVVAGLPAIRNGYVTFGSFNRGRKINHAVAALWSRVLEAVPGSRLFLKQAAGSRTPLVDLFAAHGVADRIDFDDCDVDMSSHLASYAKLDIALDTFPWNGITTTCEALWMGVPVLALEGRVHRSRAGVSLLYNVGLPEYVVPDVDHYVERAAELARDLDRLAALRAGLRGKMQASPVMDAQGFTRGLERAYREMWAEWCGGRRP